MAQAVALGIANRVIFCPASSRVERFYAAADAFLFPSPYDAFGMVVSEAMATGIPVITSRQAGASELITRGVSGFVNDAWDIDAMAADLRALVADPGLREAIGESGRAAVANQTWDAVAAETLAVYQRTRPIA
jgi:glycosyltransferase involved in cell wall biosynthesis